VRIDELLKLLEIDFPDEFEDFEHFAELIECPEEISHEAFHDLLSRVDKAVIHDLLNTYFEDLQGGIPDEETDFFTLFTTIQQVLSGLCQGAEEEITKRHFTFELLRFRNWFTFDSVVHCKDKGGKFSYDIPAIEALSLYRLEKLGEGKHEFDFSDALGYEIDEFILSVSSISLDDEIETDEDDNDNSSEDLYKDAFIDKIYPVIESEYLEDRDEDLE
jgi:hypothetical protein